ncbi:MAG: 30S ribosome-binding factor RbfA [Gemmatimonadales bacterium]
MRRRDSRRPERVSQAVKQVIAEQLQYRIRDPRVGFATVTRVEMTSDLSVARVFVSVMGDQEAQAGALAAIRQASGVFRTAVSRRIRLRTAPELRFELDRGLEHASRIDQILNKLERNES